MVVGPISRRSALLGMTAAAAAMAPAAQAQAYPSKPIKLIVPVPPGSGVDAVSRAVGGRMAESMGVPVVLDHKPGASAVVGTDALAKSAPDGYTIMMGYTAHSTNPYFTPNLPYDTAKDFTPIIYLCYIPSLLVVQPSMPVKTVKELVEHIKSKPDGKWSYASGGVGAGAHLSGEMFRTMAKLDIQHIPYKGNAPGLNDMLGGHVTLMFDIISTSLPHVQEGKLKALAITGGKRSSLAPNIPTMVEAGFPGFEVVGWYMMLAPAGLAPEVLKRLNTEADAALKDEKVRSLLVGQGFEITGGSAEDASAFLKSEMKKWGDVVATSGIKR